MYSVYVRLDQPQSHSSSSSNSVNHKIDFLTMEFRQYGVSITAVQEITWFEKDVLETQGYTFVCSGHPLV